MILILCSDLHGYTPEIPDCDVLCMVGDFQRRDKYWLNSDYFESLKSRFITIGVAGNHDETLFEDKWLGPRTFTYYLNNSSVDIYGLKIYGTPYTLLEDWPFGASEQELALTYFNEAGNNRPDIILAHQPMYNIHDRLSSRNKFNPNENCGSKSLRWFVESVKPKLFVCGHIHEGFGMSKMVHSDKSVTLCLNVSYCDENYRPRGKLIRVDTDTWNVEVVE